MIAKQKAAQEAKASANPTPTPPAETSMPVAPAETPKAQLKFGIKKDSTPAVAPQTVASGPVVDKSDAVKDSTVMSLDDLAGSEDEGSTHGSTTSGMAAFADEIPATAPERELPADLTDSQRAFVQTLDSVYEIVHDPDLFGNMIRTIMAELQECPDYMSLVADQDVHTMIRGLRSSMGLAKIKKAEKSTKARGSKKAPPTTAMMTTADEIFNSDDW